MNLNVVAKEIREIIKQKQTELQLSFIESTHTYTMLDKNSVLISSYPSVSTITHRFYEPFDAKTKSLSMCNGNVSKQKILLAEWQEKGDYATNMGSRVHYELELEAIRRYGNYKTVRQPEFVCDESQMIKSDKMIVAGNKFLDLMINDRKAVLLDTETIMGSNTLRYFGQPDKLWLATNKSGTEIYLYISDWKTNQPTKFVPKHYTGLMYPPFEHYYSTELEHYYVQLSLYAKLYFDMLKGSKYENLKYGGGIVVLLKDTAKYEEFKVPKFFIDTILKMDLKL